MKQLVAAVSRKLPRELKNFHLIKRQSIFIPYCEIGITCLTKEVTEINLFFETILKLIDIEVADVYEISAIMGVEFKLLKEAIVDMIEQKYIITSQNKLIMTPRGRKALADRKQVTIRKRNINELSVNMITGNIEESGKNAFAKPETPPVGTAAQGTSQSSEEAVAKALQTLGLTGAANTGDAGTADTGDDIFKGLNPGLKAQVEALMKFKTDAEEKEMKEICKQYAILGKTEEELLPVLKSTKAVSKEAYDQVIKTLNDAKAAVENSGTFSEIGKSGHAGASKGPDANSAEGKIDSIAKSYIEKNPTMSYVDALAKAWEDNPQLVLQYEEEAGI